MIASSAASGLVSGLLSAWLSWVAGVALPVVPLDQDRLATLAPYQEPPPRTAPAPTGFTPVFAEHIGRHGARALTSDTFDTRALELWQRAAASGEFTALGRRFGPELRSFQQALHGVGYGDLSQRGAREQHGLGTRAGMRLAELLTTNPDDRVEIVTSGRRRTIASAKEFVRGLRGVVPTVHVLKPRTDERLLHFDTTDPTYASFLGNGKQWRTALAASVARSGIDDAAQRILRTLYTADFVAAITDPVDEARAIYEVSRDSPSLADDSDTDLTRFVDPKAAETFAFLEDARVFYSRGPGVSGDERSFRPATVLLDDFFAAIDRRLAGDDTVAVFRFAHGEELVPFAALIGLPGSTTPAEPGVPFSYENNDFRTARVAGLSTNIEWVVLRNDADVTLVTVRYDEAPVRLDSCRAYTPEGFYYRLEELRRCLPAR